MRNVLRRILLVLSPQFDQHEFYLLKLTYLISVFVYRRFEVTIKNVLRKNLATTISTV